MFIDLRQLFDVIDNQKTIDYALDLSDYELFQGKPFQQPIRVKGEVINRVGLVTLHVNVSTVMSLTCDRCLSVFDSDYQEEFEHVLVRKLSGQSDDYIVVEDARLDLDDLILSDILLSLPTKILCREDCRGLCINCGANLNITDCDCEKFQ